MQSCRNTPATGINRQASVALVALFAAVTWSASAAASEIAVPVRKDDAIERFTFERIEKAAVTPAPSPADSEARPPSQARSPMPVEANADSEPGPPPPVADASGASDLDPATTYVPGVRRLKPTVPPKPPELQRWLSEL